MSTDSSEKKSISMSEYFTACAKHFTLDDIKSAQQRGNQTKDQCDKYNINACIVTYLNGAAKGYLTLNPVFWARTNYSVSETFYKPDDIKKEFPYKVFVGEID